MKINIEIFDIPQNENVVVKKCYVELLPDRFVYCHDYDVTIPENVENEQYESEEYRMLDKAIYKKEYLGGVVLTSKRIQFDEEDEPIDVYVIQILISQIGEAVEVSFNTIKKALEFQKTILNYIFN